MLGISQRLTHASGAGTGLFQPITQISGTALEVGKLGKGCTLFTKSLQLIAKATYLLAAGFGLTAKGIDLCNEFADLGQPFHGGADPQLDIGIVAGHGDPSEMKKPAEAGFHVELKNKLNMSF
ncbi:hypothetical protein ACK333_00315 [Aeromonas veronii]